MILGFLLFGLLVGAVAHLVARDSTTRGWAVSMVCGACGMLAGAFVGGALGLYGYRDPAAFVVALLGAIVTVGVYQVLAARSRRRTLRLALLALTASGVGTAAS